MCLVDWLLVNIFTLKFFDPTWFDWSILRSTKSYFFQFSNGSVCQTRDNLTDFPVCTHPSEPTLSLGFLETRFSPSDGATLTKQVSKSHFRGRNNFRSQFWRPSQSFPHKIFFSKLLCPLWVGVESVSGSNNFSGENSFWICAPKWKHLI